MSESKKHVLILDDDEAICRIVSTYLKADGYSVEYSLNGPEAFQKMEKQKPNAVLLDIHLKGEDGIDILKQIKSKYPQIVVLMVTGDYDNEEGKKAFAAGAADYVTKPVDFSYLRSTLQMQLL